MILILEIILIGYFIYTVSYSFFLALVAYLYKTPKSVSTPQYLKFAVLIPSYKEDIVIREVAKKAAESDYPKDKFEVVVIADTLKKETVAYLKSIPVTVVEVSFDKSTKVKSLNKAMEVIGDDYEAVAILDADNLVDASFLLHMTKTMECGYKAVQGERAPKNSETTLAFLDGVSEAINNHIFRQGTHVVGGAASLNGSGMCFDYPLFKSIMKNMQSVGGFDRELEMILMEKGSRSIYLKKAFVLDEKTSNMGNFKNQRKRWISSQFYYLKKYFSKGLTYGLKGNFAYLNSAILRNIQLPRLLNLGLLTVSTFIAFLFRSYLVYENILFGLFATTVLTFVISIPRKFYNRQMLKAIVYVPTVFLQMFLLLFKLKGANKKFIHTTHGHNSTNKN